MLNILFGVGLVSLCEAGLLGGILNSAHDVNVKLHETAGAFLGGLAHGLVPQVNHRPPGNKRPDETIVVVVNEGPDDHPQYGNNYNQNQPPYPNQPNSYQHGQGNYGNRPNNQNWNPNNQYGQNPNNQYGQHPNNQYGQNSNNQYGQNPNNNYGNPNNQYSNDRPNVNNRPYGNPNNQYGNNRPNGDNNRPYGNPNDQYGNNKPFDHNNQGGNYNNQNKPSYKPGYGGSNYQEQTTEHQNNRPGYNENTSKPSITKPTVTTQKPDDANDYPLFVPLGPNDYVYGGDKIDVNAPKREVNDNSKPKPAPDDDDVPIDIRIGEK